MLTRITPIPFVALLVLAACSGDDDTTDATAPDSVPATADASPTTSAAPITPPTLAPAPTLAATTAPNTTPTTTEPAPTTAAPTTTDAADVPLGPAVAVEPMRAALPGVVEITNPTVVPLLTAVAEATGNTGGPEQLLADYGLNTVPHVIIDNGTLFEVSGSFDGGPDRPEYRLDQSYIVQADAPDPAALLTSISDMIAATGAYDVETGSRTENDLEVHFVDVTGTSFEDRLARWTLVAVHLGDSDPAWQGIVELHVETSGFINAAVAVPPALVELDAKAVSEAPATLNVYRYAFNNGLNMFGGFPVRSADLYYLVDAPDTPDFAAAAAAFDTALSPTYGAGDISAEDQTGVWAASPFTWSLRVNLDNQLAAVFGSSEF